MKDLIIQILSEKIEKSLVSDLVESYVAVKDSYIQGDNESALSKSGKFVENIFRVLKYIKSNRILKEIKQHEFIEISEDLKNADGSKYSESIRILIPRIALSMIYEPRSKLGAVHVKEINPDFIDGKLTVGACDWIMAELLRLYHTRNPKKVNELITQIVKEFVPIIQTIGDEKFVTATLGCGQEILVRLSDAENGLTRTEIGKAMKLNFSPQNITMILKKLVKNREVFFTKDGRYVISDPARAKIKNLISKLAQN